MTETYCGKSCSECEHKERLQCPGCKAGPGHEASGVCSIARCCRSSRKEACLSCDAMGRCTSHALSQYYPEKLPASHAGSTGKQVSSVTFTEPVATLFWALFWVSLVDLIGSGLISLACVIAYAVIYWKLGSEEELYRKVMLYSVITSLVYSIYAWMDDISVFSIMILAISLAVGIYSEFCKHSAHASIAGCVDKAMAEKWMELWKLHIWQYCGAGLFLILFIFTLSATGIVKFLASVLAVFEFVLSILNLIFLYQTAKRL